MMELTDLAAECSYQAGRDLHPLNDDMVPYIPTNEGIQRYHELLDLWTLLQRK